MTTRHLAIDVLHVSARGLARENEDFVPIPATSELARARFSSPATLKSEAETGTTCGKPTDGDRRP